MSEFEHQGFEARHIRQPGPRQAPRIVAVEARGHSFAFELEPGLALLEAVRRGFATRGFTSGTLELGSMALGPFAYVMPALSKTGENAAFYSEIRRPAGITRLEGGAMTFGLRDGAPFFHCHALWREADGTVAGGHILPEEAIVAEPAEVTALALDGARFEGALDPETNFKIFGPVAGERSGNMAGRRVLAVRLRPNQDFAGALETACRDHGIARARIRGGVGSTIGARFVDGTEISNFATEVFVSTGRVIAQPGTGISTSIDIGVIDYTGASARGRLVNGDNPVLMTFELVLEEDLSTPQP